MSWLVQMTQGQRLSRGEPLYKVRMLNSNKREGIFVERSIAVSSVAKDLHDTNLSSLFAKYQGNVRIELKKRFIGVLGTANE